MKKNLLETIKHGFVFGFIALIVICGGLYIFIRARQNTNPSLTDNDPTALYVNNNETLSAAKRNSLVDKITNSTVDFKVTTATHNGNFGGYKAMYDWIQTNGCAGYHVCSTNELSLYYQKGGTNSTYAWFNSFLLTNDSNPRLSDCNGWTLSSAMGNIIANTATHLATRDYCSTSHAVACCKGK